MREGLLVGNVLLYIFALFEIIPIIVRFCKLTSKKHLFVL
jgi:hypothetical protein